uniref:monocarboxylate transporter 7-like isoform X2 n=1 Tax=Myxine glutinosa TaxID=7769 RepID=UPI00358E5114
MPLSLLRFVPNLEPEGTADMRQDDEEEWRWGYLIALSFFIIEALTFGVLKSQGVLFPELLLQFDCSSDALAWVPSIAAFTMTFLGPLSAMLSTRFDARPIVMLGGILVFLGTSLSAFAQSLLHLYLTSGLLTGIGYCLTFLPCLTLLAAYFNDRGPQIISIASTGECFSIFALSPGLQALKEAVGWRSTLFILGAAQLNIAVCGAMLRPLTRPQGKLGYVPEPDKCSHQDVAGRTETSDLPRPSADTRAVVYVDVDTDVVTATSPQDASFVATVIPDSSFTSFKATTSAVLHFNGDAMSVAPRSDEVLNVNMAVTVHRKDEKGAAAESSGRLVTSLTTPCDVMDSDPVSTRPGGHLLDLSLLHEAPFVCYCLYGLFATFGFFVPQLFILPLAMSQGLLEAQGALLLSVAAAAEVGGRLGAGIIYGRPPAPRLPLQLSWAWGLAGVLILFPFAPSFWGLAVCAVLFGLCFGAIAGTHLALLGEEDIAGPSRMVAATGLYTCLQSLAGLFGPPLAVAWPWGPAF